MSNCGNCGHLESFHTSATWCGGGFGTGHKCKFSERIEFDAIVDDEDPACEVIYVPEEICEKHNYFYKEDNKTKWKVRVTLTKI